MLEFDYIKSLLCERGREDEKGVEIWKNIAMLSQFGLSFITPLLLCLAGCWWLAAKAGVGGWIYILGFFFGMGGSATVAYKFYLSTVKHQKKEEKKKKQKVSFNRHV